MTESYSFDIDRPRHQARCRARLELLEQSGPQLPLGRRRIDPCTGGVTIRTATGNWVGID